MKRFAIVTCVLFVPIVILACPPKWLRGFDRSHCTATVTLVSVEQMPAEKKDESSILSCKARISNVFYGEINTNEVLHFTIRSNNEIPLYPTGTNYIVYLRRSTESTTGGQDSCKWETALGEAGIQNSTQERCKIIEKAAEDKVEFDTFLAAKEDLSSLSPLERKMNGIIIPEVDFRCANIRDVIDFFGSQSKEFDTSPVEEGKRGVTILYKLPMQANMHLIHYNAENASLLKNLKVLEWLAGCEYAITNGVVEIRGKSDLKIPQNILK